jgi:hypothetical protein
LCEQENTYLARSSSPSISVDSESDDLESTASGAFEIASGKRTIVISNHPSDNAMRIVRASGNCGLEWLAWQLVYCIRSSSRSRGMRDREEIASPRLSVKRWAVKRTRRLFSIYHDEPVSSRGNTFRISYWTLRTSETISNMLQLRDLTTNSVISNGSNILKSSKVFFEIYRLIDRSSACWISK